MYVNTKCGKYMNTKCGVSQRMQFTTMTMKEVVLVCQGGRILLSPTFSFSIIIIIIIIIITTVKIMLMMMVTIE